MAQNMATQNETNQKRVQRSMLSAIWRRRELLAAELVVVARTLLQYAFIGPPMDTWTLELMLLTAIARESSKPKHNKHASLRQFREIISIDKRMPPPKHMRKYRMAVPIKSRGLKEPLADLDRAEQGDRTIDAEWLVHDSIDQPRSRVILFLHGGAYIGMSVATHRPLCLAISKALQCRIFSVEYGLAPEHPYPEPVHDAVSAYLYLLDLGIEPENIVFAGDSAGGGLSLASLLYISDTGLPRPAGGILLSPWVDLTATCRSWETNFPYDYLAQPLESSAINPVKLYLGDRKAEDHVYASPLFASKDQMSRIPPVLIQGGGVECLRDEGVLVGSRAPSGSRYEVFDHGVHVGQFFVATPAARAAFASMARFEFRLPPAHPFDFSELDSKLSAIKPVADKPSDIVPPALFVFEEAPRSGPEARHVPEPGCLDIAPAKLKQIVSEYEGFDISDVDRSAYFAPRRLRRTPTLLESFYSMAHL